MNKKYDVREAKFSFYLGLGVDEVSQETASVLCGAVKHMEMRIVISSSFFSSPPTKLPSISPSSTPSGFPSTCPLASCGPHHIILNALRTGILEVKLKWNNVHLQDLHSCLIYSECQTWVLYDSESVMLEWRVPLNERRRIGWLHGFVYIFLCGQCVCVCGQCECLWEREVYGALYPTCSHGFCYPSPHAGHWSCLCIGHLTPMLLISRIGVQSKLVELSRNISLSFTSAGTATAYWLGHRQLPQLPCLWQGWMATSGPCLVYIPSALPSWLSCNYSNRVPSGTILCHLELGEACLNSLAGLYTPDSGTYLLLFWGGWVRGCFSADCKHVAFGRDQF